MSKAVLISIRSGWCQKIMTGQKTVEVRKTRPKMDTPFKCYIYKCGNGKVIGEFLCDEIININGAGRIPSDAARPTCLEPADLHKNCQNNGLCVDVIPKIEAGLRKLEQNPDSFKEYEEPNGWGSVKGTAQFFRNILNDWNDFQKWYEELVPVATFWIE